MTPSRFDEPSQDEHFYARVLGILAGPSRRMALLMRLCNIAYWISILGALAWLAAQAVDRRPPVIIHNATLLSTSIVAGDPVRVSYDLTRERTCETDVTWSVYDGAQEIHRFGPQHVSAAGLPGQEVFTRAWTTPANAAPGPGKLRVILAFACPGNYLQSLYPVVVVLPDIPIRIEPRR